MRDEWISLGDAASEVENTIRRKRACARCTTEPQFHHGGGFALLVRNITSSGVSQVFWLCEDCRRSIEIGACFISHEKLRSVGIDPDLLPIVEDRTGTNICVVCVAEEGELHHWAPKALFGDASEDWPKSHLCRKCHAEWHSKVTPGISFK